MRGPMQELAGPVQGLRGALDTYSGRMTISFYLLGAGPLNQGSLPWLTSPRLQSSGCATASNQKGDEK